MIAKPISPKPLLSPLKGKRVVITRAVTQADELAEMLRERYAEPLLYPCIAVAPPEDTTLLDQSIYDAVQGQFNWLVVTSSNAVNTLADRLQALNLPESALAAIRTAAVGLATAKAAINRLKVNVHSVPEETCASALADALPSLEGKRVWLPQSDIAKPGLAQTLKANGADVVAVSAYRTIVGSGGVDLPALLKAKMVDAITFTSPSTVRNFLWRLIEEGGSTQELDGVALACIGAVTLASARDCGLCVPMIVSPPSVHNLVHSLEEFFA